MTRNNFHYIKYVVKDLQESIKANNDREFDFNYGQLLAIRSVGYKIDKSVCHALVDILMKGRNEFLKIYSEDVNLDDFARILRFRDSLY